MKPAAPVTRIKSLSLVADDSMFPAQVGEDRKDLIQVLPRMPGEDVQPEAAPFFRNGRVGHVVRDDPTPVYVHGERFQDRLVPHDDGNDRRVTLPGVESEVHQPGFHSIDVLPERSPGLRVLLKDAEDLDQPSLLAVWRTGEDDGLLTALEVTGLDLAGTELVVLSACDTGIGEIKKGEGVFGLRRALILAGAQTQVVSLWKVDDQATQLLMTNYYTRLTQGVGRSRALREAQLAMFDQPAYRHPYFWAAFVTIGDSSPLGKYATATGW